MPAVALLALSGLIAAALLLRAPASLAQSWYGWAMLDKLALVAALLGFAAWHGARLAPALERREAGAGERLARSIRREMAVALLVLLAAAEMVSVHPPDLAHRVVVAG